MSYQPKDTPTTKRPEPPHGTTPSTNKQCEHKYIYLETKKSNESSIYQIGWKRLDRFFCEKCLDYQDKVQEEWSRDKPFWY